MKKLKDYEKELKTCSKCGLCQSVCPIYKETGKETIVSRGKFNLLLGLLKKDLKYTKKMDEMLSMCLNCKACDDFCPSSIKASEIISCAKGEYKKFCFPFKYNSFFKPTMFFLSLIFKIYRFSHFSYFIPTLKNFIKKFGTLGEMFLLFDKISKINVKRNKNIQNKNKTLTVIYFEGCFTKYINPSVKNALLNRLEKNNVKIIQKNFECCGISALYSGKKELYNKLKQKNTKLLEENCDYIVCDCATCLSAIKEYNKEFEYKVIDIFEWITTLEKINIKNNITYHLPCHLRYKKEKISQLLENNFENYKKMNNYDVCCGFSGEFSLKYPQISQNISNKKAQNIQKTNCETVLTSCPGCVIGIQKGLINKNYEKKVLNIIEFLELSS